MTRRVNYADNIFFLNLILRQVSSALKLSVDAELARDKLLEDIAFLDRAGSSVFGSLKSNHLLIDRLEHLKELAKFNRQFIALLEEASGGKLPGAAAVQDDREALERIRQARLRESAEIREAVSSRRSAGSDNEQIVSEQEFKFLLASEEEEGES